MKQIYQQYMYSYPHKTAYRPVKRALVEQQLVKLAGQEVQLYVHLPFCQTKCGYCNLFSVAGCSEETIEHYLDAIERQVKQIGRLLDLQKVRFCSLVLGGGTPVYLQTGQLARLLGIVERFCGVIPEKVDSVIELSPNQTTPKKLDFLKTQGFQRVSLGVQSFQADELRALGRAHSPESCHAALRQIAQQQFAQFNLDLIYGVPGQSKESLLDSLEQAMRYTPSEVFLYPLYIKPGVPLAGQCAVEEQLAMQLYKTGRDFLKAQGYFQTSMRRFTRQPPEQEPSTGCGFDQMLALGCGGRSYLGALHVCEPYVVQPWACRENLERFLQKEDFLSGLSGCLLNEQEQWRRYVIKNLLYYSGIPLADYKARFGGAPEEQSPLLSELLNRGDAELRGGRLRLTEQGLAYSDVIGPAFISKEVAARTAEFYHSKDDKTLCHLP
ncbi:MAG: coproporphyrinogen III oxidase family protein [Anaerotruncus sp.]|nr:coproporphyrinogen III oxidase family protein [Anaerotruncus sp.]